MTVRDGRAILGFGRIGGGLVAKEGKDLRGFTFCGPDRKFHEARATIEGRTVVVTYPDVKNPTAVRYAWANNPTCNLYNAEGLPASPFRTDTFEIRK